MDKIIVLIYMALAKILSIIGRLPYFIDISSRTVVWGVSLLLFATATLFTLLAYKKNNTYKTPLNNTIGILLSVSLLCVAIWREQKINPETLIHPYVIYGFGALLLLAVIVLVESFIVSWDKGVKTLMLWIGFFFYTALGIRVLYFWHVNGFIPDRSRFFPLDMLINKYKDFMIAHNFKGLVLAGEFLAVIVILALSVMIMERVRKFLPADYKTLSSVFLAGTFFYIIILSHQGLTWNPVFLGLVYSGLFMAQMIYLFMCVYIPTAVIGGKDYKPIMTIKRVMAMIWVLVVGIFWNMAALFCTDIVATGAVRVLLQPLSLVMTWFHGQFRELDFGYQTNFLTSEFHVIIGMAVAAFMAFLVILFLFLILKLILGDLKCEGVTLTWLRNSVLLFAIPASLYWFYTMCSAKLESTGGWISPMFQTLAFMGLMVCISNLVPSFRKKGFVPLVKWTLVSIIVTVLAVSILLPVLMNYA